MKTKAFSRLIQSTTVAVGLVFSLNLSGQTAPTRFEYTENVLRSDIKRMGIALDGDAIKKQRLINSGFEGVYFRTFWTADRVEGNDIICKGTFYDVWSPAYEGATLRVITGPLAGQAARILGWEKKYDDTTDSKDREFLFKTSGLKDAADAKSFKFILDSDRSDSGFIGQHGNGWWVFLKGGAKVTTETGDVPPGSRGKVVARLHAPAADDETEILAMIAAANQMEVNDEWLLQFWAKGDGELVLGLGDWNTRRENPFISQKISLTADWKQHTLKLPIKEYPLSALILSFSISGGTASLDEVTCEATSDTNPTPFRDQLVDALKILRPGVLRSVGMGGSSMENILRPDTTRMVYAPARNVNPPSGNNWPGHPEQNGSIDRYNYSLPELFELCRELRAEPWFCVPGLIFPEEVAQLVEFIAGPADTPFGKLRAELGQEKPWTEVLANIHIEFGNRAWDHGTPYNLRSYYGPDYWKSLIVAGKASPWYNNKIRFQASGHAVNPPQNDFIASHAPDADGFALGPYVIYSLSKAEANLPTEELWSMVFGYPWYHGHYGIMADNYKRVTEKHGMELSVYEVNHHPIGGDADLEFRNEVVSGIGGAINIANWMVMMLKEQNTRTQCFFNLSQYKYYYGVLLWGAVPNLKPGSQLIRPHFHALTLLNQVLEGDLVEVKSEAVPTWVCKANYAKNDPFEVPYLQAYGTKNGDKCSMILFNFHLADTLPVELKLPTAAQGNQVTRSSLTGATVTTNNEDGQNVVISRDTLPAAADGTVRFQMPPHSMAVLEWTAPQP